MWLTYNRLVALRLACENSWAQIDVALKLRHDLIPSLVAAVAGYAGHEAETLTQVAELRSGAVAADGAAPAERGTAEARLGGSLMRMLVLAEDYPELRATENFSKLQDDLSAVEERISITRRVYNDTVETYNTKIAGLPLQPDRQRLRVRASRVLRGRRRCRDRTGDLAARQRWRIGGLSVGGLIWGVIWRVVIAAIVFLFFAILPSIFIPEEGTPKDFDISTATTRVKLQDDASLRVSENLEFHYHGGSFTGAYRDIPLRDGAEITGVTVFEGDERYQPGGNTRLGSSDRPGTFGTTETPDYNGVRVVWHYDKTKTEKTFTLVYDVKNAITAYDDVLDVGWTVWGDQWQFWLDDLGAQIATPDGSDPTEAWVSSFSAPDSGAIAAGQQPRGTRALGADPEIADGDGELRHASRPGGHRRRLPRTGPARRRQLGLAAPASSAATAPTR